MSPLTLDLNGESGDNCLRSLEAVTIITSGKDNLAQIVIQSFNFIVWKITVVETHRKYSSWSRQCTVSVNTL